MAPNSLCAVVWSVMHYPSPFHFVHSTSHQVAAAHEQHKLTLTCRRSSRRGREPHNVPINFNISAASQQPPAALSPPAPPGDADPRSACLALSTARATGMGECTWLTQTSCCRARQSLEAPFPRCSTSTPTRCLLSPPLLDPPPSPGSESTREWRGSRKQDEQKRETLSQVVWVDYGVLIRPLKC